MKKAIADVKSKILSERKAATVYGVPRSTLQRHLHEGVAHPGAPFLGRRMQGSTEEDEAELIEHALKMQTFFYGLTPSELRKIAFDYATRDNLKHPFNADKRKAGRDWLNGFLQRHRQLSTGNQKPLV